MGHCTLLGSSAAIERRHGQPCVDHYSAGDAAIVPQQGLISDSRRSDGGFQGAVAELGPKTVGTGGTSVTVGSGVPTS